MGAAMICGRDLPLLRIACPLKAPPQILIHTSRVGKTFLSTAQAGDSPYHWSRPLPGLMALAAWRMGRGVVARLGGDAFRWICFGAAFFSCGTTFFT